MPRGRRPHLKERKDHRYCKVYKGQQIMGWSEDEVYDKYDAIVALEEQGVGRIKTVGEYAQEWLPIAFPDVADSTYHGYAVHLEKLVEVIGNLPINRVKPLNMKEVYSTKYLGVANSYIKSGRQLFCSFFDSAVSNGYARSNPARDRDAKPHKGKPVKKISFTPQHREWIETLCTDHRCHAAVMAMLYAGLRPPEVKALKIERDVDFQAETITLHEFAHKDGQKYEYTETGKTDLSSRTIPLFPPLKKALEGKKGYVITSAHGKQVTVQTWKVAWNSYKTAMETAINGCHKRWYGNKKEHQGKELPEWVEFNITPYTLRKAFCRWCRDNGVELNTCRRWMGHADAQMILKVYDEVSDARDEKEAERMKKLFGDMQNDMQEEKANA